MKQNNYVELVAYSFKEFYSKMASQTSPDPKCGFFLDFVSEIPFAFRRVAALGPAEALERSLAPWRGPAQNTLRFGAQVRNGMRQ